MSRYRKSFEVDASAEGKLVYLDFDGVYRAADFWLNGEWIGHHESGYAPFRWYGPLYNRSVAHPFLLAAFHSKFIGEQ